MKSKSLTAFFLALSALTAPIWALDLTPRYKDVMDGGGSVFKRLYFTDGAKYYTLSEGPNANMAAEAGAVRFTFDELEGSTFLIRNSPLTANLSFEEENLEKYRQSLAFFLPSGVSDVTVEEEKSNPFSINDWTSHGFVVACKIPGSTLRVAITFVTIDERQQIVLVTTAYREVFKAAQERSLQIISSIESLTEEKLNAPPAT